MKRIVLKVGSAVLSEKSELAIERIDNLVEFIIELRQEYEVMLVSSGAVAAGYTELALDKSFLANKQALASLGQPLLMKQYYKKLKAKGILCSQILLIADDFDSRKRTEHAKNAVEVMLKKGIVPIINENDVTATEELVFGDNDRLSAHVCYYFDASMLVVLTDVDGYYDSNPKENPSAKMYKFREKIDKDELVVEHKQSSLFATGGIKTKLQAAEFLLKNGKKMFLTSGFDLSFAREFLIEGRHTRGTLFTKGLE